MFLEPAAVRSSRDASEVEGDEVSGKTSVAVTPKYLQVALVADENVAAKHGNQTTNFLLVLANMVSFPSRNQVLVSDRLFSISINPLAYYHNCCNSIGYASHCLFRDRQ